jgi:acetolactate synthase-1/3 small subunit
MRHTLAIEVENRFGELSRVIGLFSARGINIESLTVAETLDPRISRITLVATGDHQAIDRVTGQLDKQVRVLKAVNITEMKKVERHLALIHIKARQRLQEALGLASLFRARVVDASSEGVVIEAVGDRDEVNALLELLKPLGQCEVAQSGAVALARQAGASEQAESAEACN